MTMRAGGHSALIVAVGMLVCFAGPSLAAAGADATAGTDATADSTSETAAVPVKHTAHHAKTYAHHKPGKVAQKSAADRKADTAADDRDAKSSAISPSVADAHAQMVFPETPTGNASAMTARANDILQSAPDKPADGQPMPDSQLTSADQLNQLNDADRALSDGAPAAPAVAAAPAVPMAAAETQVSPAAPELASTGQRPTSDQATLIGKVFIGVGMLLTMASAARMFMA
jgi:hypothetical protein